MLYFNITSLIYSSQLTFKFSTKNHISHTTITMRNKSKFNIILNEKSKSISHT